MMKQLKTFEDLKFKPHPVVVHYANAKQALMFFDNGYGVSVLFGEPFYSNDVDTYELAVFYKGKITYTTDITDDVLGYITAEEVTEAMRKVQLLKD